MPMNPRLLRPLAKGRFTALRVGLVAYWPMNEDAPSGDVTAEDWTRRGNDLTSNNSVLSASGKIGNAREFVAANSEFLSRTSNTDLQFGDGNWSLSCWIYVTETGTTSERMIAAKDQSGGREFFLRFTTSTSLSTNNVGFTVFYTDGTFDGLAANGRANASFINLWHHIAVVHANGVVNLYFNGAAEGGTLNRAAGKAFAATATPFNVGRRSFSGSANHANAIIDELAKWNRALSVSEIASLYNNGAGIDLRQ
jgi:hypothetical protein